MNTNLGLVGKKLGCTQVFNEDGSVTPVTAIETGPCTVIGKRTADKDGYSALRIAFGKRTKKNIAKAQLVELEALKQDPPEVIRELRVPAEQLEKFEVGQVLKPSEIFTVGQFVDVAGQTKGRGFTGVMKRWNFHGARSETHGTHEYRRHGGSIGTNMTPGRTLPNVKMGGQYGDEHVTILNLKVVKVIDDQQLVLVNGAIPGPNNGIVTVRGAVKKHPKRVNN